MPLQFPAQGRPRCGWKALPEHFQVQEVGSVEPLGCGEFLLVDVCKRDLTTPTLIRSLASHFSLSPGAIGCAGFKDRCAISSQRLSLPASIGEPPKLPGLLHWQPVGLHPETIRPGQLRGNRFTVLLGTAAPREAAEFLRTMLLRQKPVGWANYYGIQRFGPHDESWQKGLAQLRQPPGRRERARWPHNFPLNSFQSHLFNQFLRQRIEAGRFASLKAGDWCQPLPAGIPFRSDGSKEEREKFLRFELAPLGPIWGYKLSEPTDEERSLVTSWGLNAESFRPFRAPGSRRPLRLPLPTVETEIRPDGLECRFELPAGSYASVLLEHFFCLEYYS